MSNPSLREHLKGWWAVNANGTKLFQPTSDLEDYLATGNLFEKYEDAQRKQRLRRQVHGCAVTAEIERLNIKQQVKECTVEKFEYKLRDTVKYLEGEWVVYRTERRGDSSQWLGLQYGDYTTGSINASSCTPVGETQQRYDQWKNRSKNVKSENFSIENGVLYIITDGLHTRWGKAVKPFHGESYYTFTLANRIYRASVMEELTQLLKDWEAKQ